MREFERGSQKFVETDGLEIPYDNVVRIYVDTTTGNWVVSTPFHAMTMFDLLSDAVEHFAALQVAQPPVSTEGEGVFIPELSLEDVDIFPLTSTYWN